MTVHYFSAGVPGQPGAPGPMGPGMGQQVVNRRMNAIKTNHPKDMMGPNMGKTLLQDQFGHNVILQDVDKSIA